MSLDDVESLHLVENTDDAADLLRWLSTKDKIALDTEGTGLKPERDRVRLVQVGDAHQGFAIPFEINQMLVHDIVKRFEGTYLLFNAVYDVAMLRSSGVQLPIPRVEDTRLKAHVISSTGPLALKKLAAMHVDPAAANLQDGLAAVFAEHHWNWATIPWNFPQYWCVPTDTEILTRTGWKNHQDVQIGDETLGYVNGGLTWTTITDVARFQNAPIVTLGNRYWSTQCTSNHRWLIQKNDGTRLRPLADAWKDHGSTKLVLSAPAAGGDSPLTPNEASILAWVLSDGHVSWQRPVTQTSPITCITQSPSKFADVIRDLLKTEDAYTSENTHMPSGCLRFNVQATYFQRIWDAAGLREHDLSHLVLSLSREARKAWFDTWYMAEGSKRGRVLTQNRGPKLDALVLCAYLEGYTPLVTDHGTDGKCARIRLSTRRPTPQKTKITDAGRSDVWCPVTDLQSWTARDRNGNVYVTGNTYGALDPVLTYQLDDIVDPLVRQSAPMSYDLEMAAAWPVERMMRNGAAADRPYITRYLAELTQRAEKLLMTCTQDWGVRPGSSAQVADRLIKDGVDLWQRTGSGLFKMDKSVLADVIAKYHHPLAEMVLEYRQITKMTGTYLETYLKLSEHDGRVHPSINTVGGVAKNYFETGGEQGVRTGRMSANDPNLQNVPMRTEQGKKIRKGFKAQCSDRCGCGEDHVWIKCDFDQIEQRVMAHMSRDPGMKEAFLSGVDYFVAMGQQMFNEPGFQKTDTRRQLIKNAAYADIYGAGPEKFAITAGLLNGFGDPDVDRARDFMINMHDTFPGPQNFSKRVIKEANVRYRNEGEAYVRSPLTGRKLVADRGKFYALVNYLIQGMAGELLKMKIVDADAAGLSQYMVLAVHDEIDLDVPVSQAEEVIKTLGDVFNDQEILWVPVTAGIEVGPSWGQVEDVDKYLAEAS